MKQSDKFWEYKLQQESRLLELLGCVMLVITITYILVKAVIMG